MLIETDIAAAYKYVISLPEIRFLHQYSSMMHRGETVCQHRQFEKYCLREIHSYPIMFHSCVFLSQSPWLGLAHCLTLADFLSPNYPAYQSSNPVLHSIIPDSFPGLWEHVFCGQDCPISLAFFLNITSHIHLPLPYHFLNYSVPATFSVTFINILYPLWGFLINIQTCYDFLHLKYISTYLSLSLSLSVCLSFWSFIYHHHLSICLSIYLSCSFPDSTSFHSFRSWKNKFWTNSLSLLSVLPHLLFPSHLISATMMNCFCQRNL